jgi:hypothetical protein
MSAVSARDQRPQQFTSAPSAADFRQQQQFTSAASDADQRQEQFMSVPSAADFRQQQQFTSAASAADQKQLFMSAASAADQRQQQQSIWAGSAADGGQPLLAGQPDMAGATVSDKIQLAYDLMPQQGVEQQGIADATAFSNTPLAYDVIGLQQGGQEYQVDLPEAVSALRPRQYQPLQQSFPQQFSQLPEQMPAASYSTQAQYQGTLGQRSLRQLEASLHQRSRVHTQPGERLVDWMTHVCTPQYAPCHLLSMCPTADDLPHVLLGWL